ncbi:classical arabinogalactan protein 9-like [Zingiber officinale]|uniref:classical arabinogalactan protein 9-like n=1 Tax=Zingiber officinale TaxID=94328 RepID=UPI001C4C19DA|nr:classical arabinogalactan protein 9-like [Zingiber officinale]
MLSRSRAYSCSRRWLRLPPPAATPLSRPLLPPPAAMPAHTACSPSHVAAHVPVARSSSRRLSPAATPSPAPCCPAPAACRHPPLPPLLPPPAVMPARAACSAPIARSCSTSSTLLPCC